MLNNTVFSGGSEAREALAKAYLSGEVDKDWCVGGCKSWRETEEGRTRYKELHVRWHEVKQQESEEDNRASLRGQV